MRTSALYFVLIAGTVLISSIAGAEERFLWTNLDVGGNALHAIDIDGDAELDISTGRKLETVFVSGKTGEIDVPVDHYTDQIRFADMDLDKELDVVLLTTRRMVVGGVIAINFSSFGNWDTQARWDKKHLELFAVYDFNMDKRPEIIGADKKNLFIIDPASGEYTMYANTGTITSASVGYLTDPDNAQIVAYQWQKNPKGRFSYRDQWTAFKYNLKLCVIDPASGDIISRSTPVGAPVRQPITADLAQRGIDDAISISDTDVLIMRDGKVLSRFSHKFDLTYEHEELIKDMELDLSVGAMDVSDKFTGGAVGNFHSNPGLELAVTTSYGFMVALNENCKVLWSTWGKTVGDPVIADVNGDGAQEVIAVTYEGSVKALDGQSGSELYSFSPSFDATRVIVADANSDGKLDIIVSGAPGLSAWTMDAVGTIEWGVPTGDGMGTCNYGLSREYLKRIADPAAYSNYPWIVRGIAGGIILLLGLTGFLLVRHYTSMRSTIESAEATSEFAKMEKAYLNNTESPDTIIPLAREYARNKSLGMRAMEVYRKAAKIAPDDKEIVVAAAKAMAGRKIVSPETEEIFQKALNHAPDDLKFIEILARLYAEKNRADSMALHIYYKYFTAGSFNRELALTIARVLKEAGCQDNFSVWLFQQALTINTGDMEMLLTLLTALKNQNQPDQYLQWASKYISDPRLTDEMRKRIAGELEAMGRGEDAGRFMPR